MAIAEIIYLWWDISIRLVCQHHSAFLDLTPTLDISAMVDSALQTKTYKCWKHYDVRGSFH